VKKAYDASSIRQLKGLEAVRERPGMYLGDVSSGDALHRLIWEVVDNAVDEHLAGHCNNISVVLYPGGICAVADNGRGIPLEIHPEEGIPTLQLVLTSLHAGGKFDHDSYEKSAGLHGVGVSAVNAVSEVLTAVVRRDGGTYAQSFAFGKPTTGVELADVHELTRLDAVVEGTTGTLITWIRDLTIFSGVVEYQQSIVRKRLEELAFLNPGLTLVFRDLRDEKKPFEVSYSYDRGIYSFLERKREKDKGAITPILHFTDGPPSSRNVELAFFWGSGDERTACYANNTYNQDGGTHLTGFKQGLTRVVTKYAKDHGMLEKLKGGITGDDIRDGLVAVVSLRIQDLAFSSQTKDKLVSPRAKTLVEQLLTDQFEPWLATNPGVAKKIAERAVLVARAREAAKKAREDVMRKDYTDRLSLPGKLADCQTKRAEEAEIFIVEGDSAGGSAKTGRDRRFQAILPLRGKVLNVERASLEAITDNEEITTLVTALGCGLEANKTFNLDRLRYHKVIIMTDADVDGAHIRTLLLTFFYRQMPLLLMNGHVYVAEPPLYGVRSKRTGTPDAFFVDDEALNEYVSRKGGYVTRYKGLGEMNPDDLWRTTLDPSARTIRQVTASDAIVAERAFEVLMGNDVEDRRTWIEENALYAKLDI
jgi:DNA gyrase subunit B